MNQIFSNQFFTLMDLGSLEPKHAAEIWEAVSRVGLREKISSLLDVLHYRRPKVAVEEAIAVQCV